MQTVAQRQEIERKIIDKAVTDILANGWLISVDDGEEITVSKSSDKDAIMKAIMTTDDDTLHVHLHDGSRLGWIYLVYGNDGWDVINDHTINLSEVLTGANTMAEQLSN